MKRYVSIAVMLFLVVAAGLSIGLAERLYQPPKAVTPVEEPCLSSGPCMARQDIRMKISLQNQQAILRNQVSILQNQANILRDLDEIKKKLNKKDDSKMWEDYAETRQKLLPPWKVYHMGNSQ